MNDSKPNENDFVLYAIDDQGIARSTLNRPDLGLMRCTAQISESENIAEARMPVDPMFILEQLAKPPLTRVQGAAFGGAVSLICDIAIASDTAPHFFRSDICDGRPALQHHA